MDEGGEQASQLIQGAQKAAAAAMKAAGQAAIAAMYGLVALIAGTFAALLATAALVSRVAGEMLSQLATSLRLAIPAALAAVPALLHNACLAAALVAMLWAWLRLHAAYGGDWLATIPATVFAATPLLTFYVEDQTAGRAAIAAGLAVLVGWVVGFIPLWLLGCITAAIYAWLVTHIGKDNEETHETQLSHRSDRGATDLL